MWNPFKRRKPTADEAKLDELIERVRDEIESRGGFCFIGLNMDDRDGISAAALVHNLNKNKAVFTIAASLGMNATQVFTAVARFSQSKVTTKPHDPEPILSPIQKDDLKR